MKPLGILPRVEEDQTTSSDRPSTPVVKAVEKTNPFLPHSPALYVTDAGEEHKIILNKFCIVPRHFLIVTKGKILALCVLLMIVKTTCY